MGAPAVRPPERRWLTVNEAANYLKTSKANISLLVATGQIPASVTVTESMDPTKHAANSLKRMVHVDDLDAYMRRHPATPMVVA